MKNKINSVALSRLYNAFCQNRRAGISLIVFLVLFGLSLIAEFIANDKPLWLKYKGEFYFPIFQTYTDRQFGGDFPTPADYRDPLIRDNINQNGYMIFPLFPYSFNTIDYDLDVRVFSSGAFKVVDKNEYNYHKNKFKYPKEIDYIIKEQLNNLINEIRNKKSYFNNKEIENWVKYYLYLENQKNLKKIKKSVDIKKQL